jgi:hypothetical protein
MLNHWVSLRVVISRDEQQKDIIASDDLPYRFDVVSKKRPREEMEEDDENPAQLPASKRNPGLFNNGMHIPTVHQNLQRASAEGSAYEANGSASNVQTSAEPLSQPNAQPNPLQTQSGSQRIDTPSRGGPLPTPTDSLDQSANADITLIEVNPSHGPTSGGEGIFLYGSNFPSSPRLFVRFGTNVACTVRRSLPITHPD